MVLAFQTDTTRVCTHVFANESSNRTYHFIGVRDAHHELSHHQNNKDKQAKIKQINTFHVQQLAYLLERLRSVPEGDGTLLDHSMIVYGSAIADGNRHNHEDVPTLLLGKGCGTIQTGRHVRYPVETPINDPFKFRSPEGDAHRRFLAERTPSGVSFYKVEDINGTVVYLASDDSAAVTGVTIPIDGGRHLTCAR